MFNSQALHTDWRIVERVGDVVWCVSAFATFNFIEGHLPTGNGVVQVQRLHALLLEALMSVLLPYRSASVLCYWLYGQGRTRTMTFIISLAWLFYIAMYTNPLFYAAMWILDNAIFWALNWYGIPGVSSAIVNFSLGVPGGATPFVTRRVAWGFACSRAVFSLLSQVWSHYNMVEAVGFMVSQSLRLGLEAAVLASRTRTPGSEGTVAVPIPAAPAATTATAAATTTPELEAALRALQAAQAAAEAAAAAAAAATGGDPPVARTVGPAAVEELAWRLGRQVVVALPGIMGGISVALTFVSSFL